MKNILSAIPSSTGLREEITAFIVKAVKPYVDEKGVAVGGIRLYVLCKTKQEEENLLIALKLGQPEWFKKEWLERKFMDQFIALEENWFFECLPVTDALPADLITENNLAVEIVKNNVARTKFTGSAKLLTLKGQTADKEFVLDPAAKNRFYIGRTRQPQLASGKIQENDIVFLGTDEPGYTEESGRQNQHVSRNHALIIYESRTDKYFLFPDKGGLPENGNKTRVHTQNDTTKLLSAAGVGHELRNGDQIELGGKAILLFRRE